MQTTKYDKKKHEQEKIDQKIKDAEIKDKKEYFEFIRKDERFKKYVIEGIIDKAIESHKAHNFDLDALLVGKPEEIRTRLLNARASIEQLKTIKNDILRG